MNLDNCATFESVESELRCLDREVYTGRDSRFGQSVEFLREEDIFYEKSVFENLFVGLLFCFFFSCSLWKYKFLLEDEIYFCIISFKKNIGRIFFVW